MNYQYISLLRCIQKACASNKNNLCYAPVSGMAPSILRGVCPSIGGKGCDKCMQKQVGKAIAHMQRFYPYEFNQLVSGQQRG